MARLESPRVVERLKIIGAWLTGLLILCGAWLGLILHFLRNAERAGEVRLAANRIRIQELEARRAEKDFLLRSLTDDLFLEHGDSEYPERHAAVLLELTAALERMSGMVHGEQAARVLSLNELVRRYEAGFRRLVAAYRARGRGEHGLEGALADARRALQDAVDRSGDPTLDRAMLDLDRAEHVFRAQREPEDVHGVTRAVAALRERVPAPDPPPGSLGPRIGAYERSFHELVRLEEEIGRTEDVGLQRELREAIHEVEPIVASILADATRAERTATLTLTVGILVACVIMAALLGLVLFFAQASRLRNRSLIRLNREMEAEHARLLRAERLAAIGEMIAGLAHESRNAFQRTHACLDMLSREVEDRAEALALIAKVEESQDHLHMLYEQVREYAAPLRVHRVETRLDDVVRSAWEQLDVLRKDRVVNLVEVVGDIDPRCEVDAFALQQVFRNIFENSLAACTDPVEVEVEFRDVRLGAASALEIEVRDDGPGFGVTPAARVFEPFFTTKTRGTGLGLAIARRIVEAHRGTITAARGGAQGAVIVVTLPREA